MPKVEEQSSTIQVALPPFANPNAQKQELSPQIRAYIDQLQKQNYSGQAISQKRQSFMPTYTPEDSERNASLYQVMKEMNFASPLLFPMTYEQALNNPMWTHSSLEMGSRFPFNPLSTSTYIASTFAVPSLAFSSLKGIPYIGQGINYASKAINPATWADIGWLKFAEKVPIRNAVKHVFGHGYPINEFGAGTPAGHFLNMGVDAGVGAPLYLNYAQDPTAAKGLGLVLLSEPFLNWGTQAYWRYNHLHEYPIAKSFDKQAQVLSDAGLSLETPTDLGTVYRVRPNDNLQGIARMHGITVDDLKGANSLKTDIISPGDILYIPGSGAKINTRPDSHLSHMDENGNIVGNSGGLVVKPGIHEIGPNMTTEMHFDPPIAYVKDIDSDLLNEVRIPGMQVPLKDRKSAASVLLNSEIGTHISSSEYSRTLGQYLDTPWKRRDYYLFGKIPETHKVINPYSTDIMENMANPPKGYISVDSETSWTPGLNGFGNSLKNYSDFLNSDNIRRVIDFTKFTPEQIDLWNYTIGKENQFFINPITKMARPKILIKVDK